MDVALEKPAGLVLGVLWTLKMLVEWLLLVVGLDGATGFQSYLSARVQLPA